MSTSTDKWWEGENVINIMVATDNHLGFCEKDPIRGDDSFVTFEEILELAVEHDVDFILLGGDLFHDATPSQNSLHKCMKLLRQYTQGDREISVEVISDQSLAFHDALNQTVNYEDPKMNISIPVFSINGNHDDPSNFGTLSSLNLLAINGLVNYFGRWTDLSQVEINPILLRKGETQIALYGLSHIRDGRLNPLFEAGKVNIKPPDGEWFNLMVLHQNRAFRGPKSHVEEEFLPEFLDLVVWGHEHDCRIKPETNATRKFKVTQPGSSVATSLSAGEAKPKHVAILQVLGKEFQLLPLPLQTVRPFIFKTIKLADYRSGQVDTKEKVEDLAHELINQMIAASDERLTGHPKQPKLPLIRLRVVYNDVSQVFNEIRFGQKYSTRVANPADVLLFKKPPKPAKKGEESNKTAADSACEKEEVGFGTTVEDIVGQYFAKAGESKQLQFMTRELLWETFSRIVGKEDDKAEAAEVMKLYEEEAVKRLMETQTAEDQCSEEIQKFLEQGNETYNSVLKSLRDGGSPKKVGQDDDLPDASPSTSSAKKTKSRASGTGDLMEIC